MFKHQACKKFHFLNYRQAGSALKSNTSTMLFVCCLFTESMLPTGVLIYVFVSCPYMPYRCPVKERVKQTGCERCNWLTYMYRQFISSTNKVVLYWEKVSEDARFIWTIEKRSQIYVWTMLMSIWPQGWYIHRQRTISLLAEQNTKQNMSIATKINYHLLLNIRVQFAQNLCPCQGTISWH